MDKKLINEELSRIWEIMGVPGSKSLLVESWVDDLIGAIVKSGRKGGSAIGKNATQQLAKIAQDFPYMKGLDANDLKALIRGGDEVFPVLNKVIKNMSDADLTDFAADIYKNSSDLNKIAMDQINGIKPNIANGSLDAAGAAKYVDDNIGTWITKSGVDASDDLVIKLRTQLKNDILNNVGTTASKNVSNVGTTVTKTAEELAQEAKTQEIMATLGKFEGAVDDVTGEAISTPSKIKEAILQSSEFTTAYDKLPARVRRNVTKEQFAQQAASDLAQKVKVRVDDLPPQLWKTDAGMTETQKLELFDQSTKKFKQRYPTAYQKTREWLIKKGLGNRKNWVYVYSTISVIYFVGELNSGAIPPFSDVDDPLEYGKAIIDATVKAALAPIGVGIVLDASGLDLESDYFNTLPSFRDYLVDKQNFSKETVATQTRPVFGDVGKYEAMGPDGVKRTYIYDEDQGTYFPYDSSKDVNKAPNTPTPTPSPTPNTPKVTCPGKAAFESALKTAFGTSYNSTKLGTFDDTNCKGTYGTSTYTWDGNNWN